MADYQAMYAVLFRKITSIVEELQSVQRQTEEMYISSEPPSIRVIRIDEMKDEKSDE